MNRLKNLLNKLLHVEDTPKKTAFSFSIGVFLGFSPFLGFHTLGGLAIAFLFKLSRMAILLGVWMNTPWWMIPYYTLATWIGMRLIGFHINLEILKVIFQVGMDHGFLGWDFWGQVASQRELFLSFVIGSLTLGFLLGLVAYLSSLNLIKFYHLKGQSLKSPKV